MAEPRCAQAALEALGTTRASLAAVINSVILVNMCAQTRKVIGLGRAHPARALSIIQPVLHTLRLRCSGGSRPAVTQLIKVVSSAPPTARSGCVVRRAGNASLAIG